MPLSALQASIAAALRAAPAFAGITVIEDDGATVPAQEQQLATRGAVLVVSPCLALRRRESARVAFDMVAVFAVHLRTKPAVNLAAGGAHIAPPAALADILRAVVLAHRTPSGSHDAVAPSADFADLVQEDSGLLTYSALFEASVNMDAKL